MPALTIDTRANGGTTVLALGGEFDLAVVERFDRELRAVEARAPETVVVDLGGVEFMDSSGLRALVTAHDRAQRGGWRLAIVPGPPPVRRVFEITQLVGRLDLVDDASAAGG